MFQALVTVASTIEQPQDVAMIDTDEENAGYLIHEMICEIRLCPLTNRTTLIGSSDVRLRNVASLNPEEVFKRPVCA